MGFQTVAKAVELKNLIDNAPPYLPTIGRCVSLELDFKREYMLTEEEVYLDEDEDEYGEYDENDYEHDDDTKKEGGKQETLEKFQDKLVRIYEFEGFRMENSGFKDDSITVLGKRIQSLDDVSLKHIEEWYALGKNSGFGNVMKQENQ